MFLLFFLFLGTLLPTCLSLACNPLPDIELPSGYTRQDFKDASLGGGHDHLLMCTSGSARVKYYPDGPFVWTYPFFDCDVATMTLTSQLGPYYDNTSLPCAATCATPTTPASALKLCSVLVKYGATLYGVSTEGPQHQLCPEGSVMQWTDGTPIKSFDCGEWTLTSDFETVNTYTIEYFDGTKIDVLRNDDPTLLCTEPPATTKRCPGPSATTTSTTTTTTIPAAQTTTTTTTISTTSTTTPAPDTTTIVPTTTTIKKDTPATAAQLWNVNFYYNYAVGVHAYCADNTCINAIQNNGIGYDVVNGKGVVGKAVAESAIGAVRVACPTGSQNLKNLGFTKSGNKYLHNLNGSGLKQGWVSTTNGACGASVKIKRWKSRYTDDMMYGVYYENNTWYQGMVQDGGAAQFYMW